MVGWGTVLMGCVEKVFTGGVDADSERKKLAQCKSSARSTKKIPFKRQT